MRLELSGLGRVLAMLPVAGVAALSSASVTHGQLLTNGDAARMEACEVRRLGGGIDVPDWQAFRREPVLELDRAGRLHVRQVGEPMVTVLDSTGSFLRYVGREGQGPGEFTVVAGMGFAGDTLWLYDFPGTRTSFFDTAGVHLRTEVTASAYPVTAMARDYSWSTHPLAGGYALFIPPAESEERYVRTTVPMMVGRRDRADRDTLMSVTQYPGMRVAGVGYFRYEPVPVPPLWAIVPSGIGIATADWNRQEPDVIAVRRYGSSGSLIAEKVIPTEAVAIAPELRRSIIGRGMEMASGPYNAARRGGENVPPDLRAAVAEGLGLPDYHAPVAAIFATHDGNVWLHEARGASTNGGDWIVMDSDLQLAFRILPPSGVTFQAAREGWAWGTGTGDLDIPYIALFRLSEGTCDAG